MENLLRRINSSSRAKLGLKIISHGASIAVALAFVIEISYLFYIGDMIAAITAMAFAAVGYAAVTVFRALLDAPRPYELYGFYEIPPKNKKGRSFPSRHAYSAFVIATLALYVHPIAAAVLYALGAAIALSRILLGIHFIRDILAGAILGVIAGAMVAIFV